MSAANARELPERRRRIRSGDVLLMLIVGAAFLVFLTFDYRDVFRVLYSPMAGLLLLVVIVEFLLLKSTDRTRIYKLEIDRLRRQKRDDDDLIKRSRELLREAAQGPVTEEEGRRGDWRREALDYVDDVKGRL